MAAMIMLGMGVKAQCNSQVSTINENFNNVADYQLPNCWKAHYVEIPNETGNYVLSGEYRIQRFNGGTVNHMGFVAVMPQSTVKGPVSFDLRKYPNGAPTNQLTLELGTMSNPNDPLTFTPFQSVQYFSSTPHRFTVDFSAYSGTNKYIAFRCALLPGEGFGIDNLTFSGPLPNAPIGGGKTTAP